MIDPQYRKEIIAKLHAIETREKVKIVMAVESGSRAWGFPSPDSDYDARFVYVREPDWYLSITPGRDVIELPIDDLLDINGWDIKKALGLLLKPNPVLLEWLSSPIRYLWSDDICEVLNAFSREVSHGAACIYHYKSIAKRQWAMHVEGQDNIKLKKYFYILRPALVIRWLRMNPTEIPPMNFQALIAGVELDENIAVQVEHLLELKTQSRETGLSRRWPDLDAFIHSELRWAEDHAGDFKPDRQTRLADANDLFRKIIKDSWQT